MSNKLSVTYGWIGLKREQGPLKNTFSLKIQYSLQNPGRARFKVQGSYVFFQNILIFNLKFQLPWNCNPSVGIIIAWQKQRKD